MKIARRSRFKVEIPTASTSDIAFLLILFFMVSTVFRTEQGIHINLPKAKSTERIRLRRNTVNVWVDNDGFITVQDKRISLAQLGYFLQNQLAANPDLIVLLRADKEAKYGVVNKIVEKMKAVKALRLVFATDFEE